MVAVAFSQGHKAAAVEIDSIEVNEIRILVRISATSPEPELAIFLINAINAANNEFAFGNLVFDFRGFRIHKVEMTPTVALGGINHFIGFFEPVDVTQAEAFRVRGPDERFALFIYQIAK